MKKQILIIATLGLLTIAACKKDVTNNTPEKEMKAVVTTVAGTGEYGSQDGSAATAKFYRPCDVSALNDGSLLVTDFGNSRVRKIANGQVTNFAGNGDDGITNGNGINARFREVSMAATDAAGNLYVLDGNNPQVRKITPAADVSVYAFTGVYGFEDGPVATAKMRQGWGMLVDPQGNVIIADTYNDRIRKISANGNVTTIAGSGIAGYADGNGSIAQFNKPYGIAMDKQGNIYVADNGNYRIRKISPDGMVSTFAGDGTNGYRDSTGLQAQFDSILDMVADSRGNLYLTDQHRIRKITPAGKVTTIAGSVQGFKDGEGIDARFDYPEGLDIDKAGNIYVSDRKNNRIRKISFVEK